jgi:hypothetical protein
MAMSLVPTVFSWICLQTELSLITRVRSHLHSIVGFVSSTHQGWHTFFKKNRSTDNVENLTMLTERTQGTNFAVLSADLHVDTKGNSFG